MKKEKIHTKLAITSAILLMLGALFVSNESAFAGEFSKAISPMTGLQWPEGFDEISFVSGSGGGAFTEGPNGESVLRFEGQSTGGVTGRVDASFSGRIDLTARGINIEEYDLITVARNFGRGGYRS